MLPNLYKRSFHSSGVVGILGACVTTAKLMKLDATRMRQAIGIAASMAAGLRVNFGTMTKPLHVGRAAENGLTAARLAARGFEADPISLDGPWGYCRAFADGVTDAKLSQGFGRVLTIVDPVSIKPYPSGILTHQAMDGMLQLVESHDLAPENVDRVSFFAGSNILNPIRYAVANDHLLAKFSMAALLSMMILKRRAGPAEFTNAFVRSATMQDMQRCIETTLDPKIESMGTDIIRSRIEVKTKDGRRLVQDCPLAYRGGPSNPFTQADLEGKFGVCTDGALSAGPRRQVLEAVTGLEHLADSGRIAELIQPDTRN
jgi:2-methylcitrate dehydratase PrpD